MDLIPTIISGAVAIVGAVVVKIIADDAKEWTPWVTRRLLDIAVRNLPEGQRDRYAEEWAAHLAEVPGVVGKLAVSLQFQVAAFGARELDAKARLDVWRNEQVAVLAEIGTVMGEVFALAEAQRPPNRIDEDTLKERERAIVHMLRDYSHRHNESEFRPPALGITVAGATLMTERILIHIVAKLLMTSPKPLALLMSVHDGILKVLGRLKK